MSSTSGSELPGGPSPPSKVVVGVDGSEHSLLAVRWAAHYASTMGLPLEVLTAWTFPEEPAPLGLHFQVFDQEEQMAEAQTKLDQLVHESLQDENVAQVSSKVVLGRPAEVLVSETQPNDLLVVGSLGRGALERVLFGSVANQCARHACSTVVVVR